MKKSVILMTVGLALIASSVFVLSRPKKSSARQNKTKQEDTDTQEIQTNREDVILPPREVATQIETEPSAVAPVKPSFNSLRVIGDSQVERTLGKSAQDAFDDINVTYFGKSGYTVEKYLNDSDALNNVLSRGADVFYIQLGDNGVSSNKENIRGFVQMILSRYPNSKIIWGGPVKAVAPSIQSSYVTTSDTTSPRYIHTYNRTRQDWIRRLQEALQGLPNVYFLDLYRLQESQPRSSAFSDSRKGDGIHLTKDSAQEFMRLLEKAISNMLYSQS